jgi:hypothetical protein
MSLIRKLVIAAATIATLAASNAAFPAPETSAEPKAEIGGGSAVPTYTPTLW